LPSRDNGEAQGDLARRGRHWRTLAARNVSQGRQILRKLLSGRVRLTPREGGRFDLSGADYGKLFSGIPLATAMASLIPASWNQMAYWLQQIDGLRRAAWTFAERRTHA
jgi:hypothetical protein